MKKNNESVSIQKDEFTSSTIKSAMYNYHSKILHVKFNNGKIYKYYGVDDDTYRKFTLAESQGKAFHDLIKDKFTTEAYSEDEYISEVKDTLI